MNEIIEKVIKNDILCELLEHYKNYNYIEEEDYIKFCEKRINIYIKQIELNNNINKKFLSRDLFKNKKDMCHARIWINGQGGQCSHKIINNNLCKKHNNMIEKYGKLRFGNIYEPNPKIDLIQGDTLRWL